MNNQKLYALKTSDTGEWVRKSNTHERWFVSDVPQIFTNVPFSIRGMTINMIKADISNPVEWVEVVISPATFSWEEMEKINPLPEGTIKYGGFTMGAMAVLAALGIKME